MRYAGWAISVNDSPVFDTLKISDGPRPQDELVAAALANRINLRIYDDGAVGSRWMKQRAVADLETLFTIFGVAECIQH